MKYETKRLEPGIVVLVISGRFLMGQDCRDVDREIERHIAENNKSFVFDLSAVDHIDSGAVGQIVKSLTRLKNSGGALRLAGVHGMVEGVLKMTRLDRVIEMFPTPAEAAQNFPQPR